MLHSFKNKHQNPSWFNGYTYIDLLCCLEGFIALFGAKRSAKMQQGAATGKDPRACTKAAGFTRGRAEVRGGSGLTGEAGSFCHNTS